MKTYASFLINNFSKRRGTSNLSVLSPYSFYWGHNAFSLPLTISAKQCEQLTGLSFGSVGIPNFFSTSIKFPSSTRKVIPSREVIIISKETERGEFCNQSTESSNFSSESLDSTLKDKEEKKKPSISVVILDDKGNTVGKVISKLDLMQSVKIPLRDLRSLETSGMNATHSVLVREKAIVINMLHIKAIIEYDHLIVFDHTKINVQCFLMNLAQHLRKRNIEYTEDEYSKTPFELKALEGILTDIYQTLEQQLRELKPIVHEELTKLSDGNVSENVLRHRNVLSQLGKEAQKVHAALLQVWESDDDMASMYLTVKATTGHSRRVDQHEEVEILLETYIRQIGNIVSEITQLQHEIVATDEFLTIQLDSVRNKIMRLNLILSIGTLTTTLCSVIVGIFGMNLISTLEDSTIAFPMVVLSIVLGNSLLFAIFYLYCRRKRIL